MLKRFFLGLLNKCLPDRSKRIILISSLLGCMDEKRHLEDRYLELLNTRLGLSHGFQELKFPMSSCQSIWPGDTVKSMIGCRFVGEDETREISKALLRFVPDWLKYSNESAIVDDIASAIRFETSVGSSMQS